MHFLSKPISRWISVVACPVALLSACVGAVPVSTQPANKTPSATQPTGKPANYVRFTNVAEGAILKNRVNVEVKSNLDEEPGTLKLLMDGKVVASFEQLIAVVELSTTQFEDGHHLLGLKATTAKGDTYTDEVNIAIDNPSHKLRLVTPNQYAYGAGEEIVLKLQYTEPGLSIRADFGPVDSGFDASKVKITELGNGLYELRYTISKGNQREPRNYVAPIVSTGKDGKDLVAGATIQFLGAPRLPLKVDAPGAVFTDFAFPLVKSPTGPKIEKIKLPERLIQGHSESITVRWSASKEDLPEKVVLSSSQASGSWVVPIHQRSQRGEITFSVDAPSNPTSFAGTSLPVNVALVGASGTSAGAAQLKLDVVAR